MDQTFYDVIGVAHGCTQEELRRAYRKRALEIHPDKSKHPDANLLFSQLVEAFEILSDGSLKEAYDMELHNQMEKKRKYQEMSHERQSMRNDLEQREAEFADWNRSQKKKTHAGFTKSKIRSELQRFRKELDSSTRDVIGTESSPTTNPVLYINWTRKSNISESTILETVNRRKKYQVVHRYSTPARYFMSISMPSWYEANETVSWVLSEFEGCLDAQIRDSDSGSLDLFADVSEAISSLEKRTLKAMHVFNEENSCIE